MFGSTRNPVYVQKLGILVLQALQDGYALYQLAAPLIPAQSVSDLRGSNRHTPDWHISDSRRCAFLPARIPVS